MPHSGKKDSGLGKISLSDSHEGTNQPEDGLVGEDEHAVE